MERANKEQNLNAFMEKERKRKRESYVPFENLGERAHKRRKKEVNERVKRHYLKKISQMTPENNIEDGPGTSKRSHEKTTILVKFPSFRHNKGKGLRKRYKGSLKNAQRKIQELEQKNVASATNVFKREQRTCLYPRHQNIALKHKAMMLLGLNLPKSPDAFITEQDTNEKLKERLGTGLLDMVKYTQWKNVVEGQNSRWKEVDEAVAKTDFVHLMDSETSEFRNRVRRVKVQYQEMRNLRENLPENEVMLWMYFAENFLCTSVEAVKSSYWNQAMVSLHTMVVYFPKSQG
ncbi:hypothetical protein CHS0354_022506 [Potamilus streckersoni]|uniref:Uncharacterized protein n=1 Tax=Potamilus streckersoni TaxID=2493646 RepID=A0AAE0W4N9_9BIVA|nr:hypothetical protein CHS0354_022506 [Potamilus streckersoni]